jgi:pectinesterase
MKLRVPADLRPRRIPAIAILSGILLLCTLFSNPAGAQRRITVSQDGSGNHLTIQAAINALPKKNARPVIIFVRRGVYREKLVLDSNARWVTLEGEDKFHTIITYDDHSGRVLPSGDTVNTYTSQTVRILAPDFTARNISFANTAGFTAGQAVAVQAAGDRQRFINCRFLGNQDVLFLPAAGTRQYFRDCYIEGTTDFIFGAATAWFEKCLIYSKKNSHVTAASTPASQRHGFVFNECILTADTTLRAVSLGRPWRPYSSVVYLRCYLGRHILPEGWNNWRNEANERTARYAEFECYGPGAGTGGRLKWTRQLSMLEAAGLQQSNVLGGWAPEKER